MNKYTYSEIREKYINFFLTKGHKEIPSSSLIPEDDPSVLFVNAGMFPLVPFLKGEKHPLGNRLVNSQRCLRTGDIDEVGDTSHCTTFEMLGNWSLNEYFKKEAIQMTVEFFVEELGFDINKIYASVFKGEDNIPKDEVSIQAWKEIYAKYGIDAKVGDGEKIQEYGKKENWWGLSTGGPCGPDSEIFIDTGKEPCSKNCNINCNCGKYLEIGNNVFMEYLLGNGEYKPLGRHNVDFGGGLERLAMISQEKESYFETDIYLPILEKVKSISTIQDIKSQRIVVDHIKASVLIIMDGVEPSRNEQGYILRRLIRRSVRHAKKIGINNLFTKEISSICIDQFKNIYPQLDSKKESIIQIIEEEEIKFGRTLENGLKELDKIIKDGENLSTKSFKLYETYGFPIELTIEELKNRNIEFNEENLLKDFKEEQKKHQELSRTSSSGMFKGGLADTSDMSVKYHTTTHLLLASLRNILGDHIYQKGSNITPERLRLDFPNDTKLTDEQIKQVEDLVNEKIKESLPITYKEYSKEEALKLVKYASFEDRYGDSVKVYTIGDESNPFSREICRGPHVSNTNELGHFKIVKQENIGSGIKRIKGILE